jgi:hypothetical protein
VKTLDPTDPDFGKDEDYIQRRNFLLKMMKKQRWDDSGDSNSPLPPKRGRKPVVSKPKQQNPIPKIDITKPRNKFFKFD